MMSSPLRILKEYWGYDSFREPQDEIIQELLHGKDVIALLPTGGGKSVCYQVPAMLKEGLCLVISPLIALMNDQVEGLQRKGIKAMDLSGNISLTDLQRMLDNCLYDDYKFLYISPERLQNEWVAERIKAMDISLIAIDEAHCVSHWGRSFRPSYLQCHILREWHPSVPMIALTATATQPIVEDIRSELRMENAEVIRTSLYRPNLAYMVYPTEDKHHYLQRILQKNQGSAILYLNSRRGTEQMADYLLNRNITATSFHGGLTSEEKSYRLGIWMSGDCKVMVATKAFGMGIDKPDVRTVIHWEIPQNIEDYFQEVGRAGRDGQKSFGVLLYDERDLQNFKASQQQEFLEFDFLKKLYKRLNQYFQIALNEGQEETFRFQLIDFCSKYQLPMRQVYSGLQVLENAGILEKKESSFQQTEVQILVSPTSVLKFATEQSFHYELLHHLIRTYTSIYNEISPIRVDKIAKKLGVPQSKVTQQLGQLAKSEVLEYHEQFTDMQITFKMSRDDDRTINTHAKNIKLYKKICQKQYQSMLDYLEDDSECKSIQLLRYFDEPLSEPCGICSYCIRQKQQLSKKGKKELSDKVLVRLSEKAYNSKELATHFSVLEEVILEVLECLLEQEKISLEINNKYRKHNG